MSCHRALFFGTLLASTGFQLALVEQIPKHAGKTSDAPLSQSPLSFQFDYLTQSLERGIGRSRAVWECYRMGIDPLWFYDETKSDSQLDDSVHTILNSQGLDAKSWTRDELKMLITGKRRDQGLGNAALDTLRKIGGEPIEESVATISDISVASDGTTKLLVHLVESGFDVETVIIPWKETGRSTLCISSQVGCAQGCTFCATGKMGRLQNLSSDEICAQVFLARKVCRVLDILPVDGVVFMGMGEPADNAANVVRAANVLTSQEQFGMAKRKVTISTVAPTPDAFMTLGQANTILAWSVHATTPELRKELVPTTKFSMNELRDGYLDAMKSRPKKLRTTMLEVVLIDEINDSVEDADHLAQFVQEMIDEVPGMKPMINLIPFNDIGFQKFKKPKMESVRTFQKRLISRGMWCFIRTTRGDEESAACGQLATKRKRVNEETADN